jgi:hypothetical protein
MYTGIAELKIMYLIIRIKMNQERGISGIYFYLTCYAIYLRLLINMAFDLVGQQDNKIQMIRFRALERSSYLRVKLILIDS